MFSSQKSYELYKKKMKRSVQAEAGFIIAERRRSIAITAMQAILSCDDDQDPVLVATRAVKQADALIDRLYASSELPIDPSSDR